MSLKAGDSCCGQMTFQVQEAERLNIDQLREFLEGSRQIECTLEGKVGRTIDNVVLYPLMQLAASSQASEQVKALAWLRLDELRNWPLAQNPKDTAQRAQFGAAQIKRFQDDPKQLGVNKPAEAPAGSPI